MTRSMTISTGDNWYINLKKASSIQLNTDEQFIFNLLNYLKNNSPFQNVQMRVAGGWVRDQLMGKDSDDIDIALSYPKGSKDIITGEMFVNAIFDIANRIYDNNNPVIDKWVVPSNEMKSKNISPAALKILAPSGEKYKIEFVNLRTEEYSEDSRVPVVSSTNDPEEDAIRRDLTINGLFYNIADGQIEDYVGGIEDLKTMTLKTPLHAEKTFTDDPLRMLRVLRFYSKYNNAILDEEIIKALYNPQVQSQYNKLADERASAEIIKMMQGENPERAVRLLLDSGLYKNVFKVPESFHDIHMDQQNKYHNLTLMEHILKVIDNINDISKSQGFSDKERGLLNLSALFHDFGKMSPSIRKPRKNDPQHMTYINHEIESYNFVQNALKRMGLDQKDRMFVETVVKKHMDPHDFGSKNKDRNIGRFLNEVEDLYEYVIHHSSADALAKDREAEEEEAIKQERHELLNYVQNYKQNKGDLIYKPLLNGNEIKDILFQQSPELVEQNAFFSVKGGKPLHYLSQIINLMMKEQWSGNIKTKEEAIDFVNKKARMWGNVWKQQSQKSKSEQSN